RRARRAGSARGDGRPHPHRPARPAAVPRARRRPAGVMSVLLGLDIGTSAVKALVVERSGGAWRASVPYASTTPAAGAVEQDARESLASVESALAATGAPLDRVSAIGLVGQTPTLVLVDAGGDPVRPVMTWQDVRASAEARRLGQELGDALPL